MDAISADNWRRIEHVLDAALELPAGERATYVGEACGGDVALMAQVEALIALTDSPSPLDSVASDFAAPMLDALPAHHDATPDQMASGATLGRYTIVRELGRGGMGTVYLADRADGTGDRRAAIKLVAHDRKSQQQLHQRFLIERDILARLDHPNIAALLDAGVTNDGQPWFAMEYVDGTQITEHCDARRLSVHDRVRLFQSVCSAVQHAHTNLVVHRDLKPSNILVTADGVVKLLDFGIAKALSEESLAQPRLTRASQRLMTPEYAAPEQLVGEPVTAATDVYALAAILYELVSGRRVYRLEYQSPGEMLDLLFDSEPEPPSDAVIQSPPRRWPSTRIWPTGANLAGLRATTEEGLRSELANGLDAIILRALAKNPADRHPSAGALLDDLQGQLSSTATGIR